MRAPFRLSGPWPLDARARLRDVDYSYDATTLAIAVGLGALVVWCYAAYDFSKTDEAEIQTFDRTVWLVLLTFGSVLGALLWLSSGRPRSR